MKVIDENDAGSRAKLVEQRDAIDQALGLPRAPDSVGRLVVGLVQHTLHECQLRTDEITGLDTMTVTANAEKLDKVKVTVGGKQVTIDVSKARDVAPAPDAGAAAPEAAKVTVKL